MSSRSEGKERKEKVEKEMKTEAKMLPSESRLTGRFLTFPFHLSLSFSFAKRYKKYATFPNLVINAKQVCQFYTTNGKKTPITNIKKIKCHWGSQIYPCITCISSNISFFVLLGSKKNPYG